MSVASVATGVVETIAIVAISDATAVCVVTLVVDTLGEVSSLVAVASLVVINFVVTNN